MTVQPEEVLNGLVKAVEDARVATRDAHAATKEYRNTVKDQKAKISDEIDRAVKDAIGVVVFQVTEEMRAEARAVIARIEADWRAKLDL